MREFIWPPRPHLETTGKIVEVRTLKWPRRPQTAAVTHVLGEDSYGLWLGVRQDDIWWTADGLEMGTFETPIVKLVPPNAYWSVCFRPSDPIVDVDIVLPPVWKGDVLEEIDLEIDVLRGGDGVVEVRDRDVFDRVRESWPMPIDVVQEALETCQRIRAMVERREEPFQDVGPAWLARLTLGGATS